MNNNKTERVKAQSFSRRTYTRAQKSAVQQTVTFDAVKPHGHTSKTHEPTVRYSQVSMPKARECVSHTSKTLQSHVHNQRTDIENHFALTRTPRRHYSPTTHCSSNTKKVLHYIKHNRSLLDSMPGIAVSVVFAAIVGVCIFIGISQQDQDASVDIDTSSPAIFDEVSDIDASVDEEEVWEVTEFIPSALALDSISSDEGVQVFSLSDRDAIELDNAQVAVIIEAIEAIAAVGNVSFVFYDLESGYGISFNPDTEIYGASSFKALYALYVCETLIDTDSLSLMDRCPVSTVIDRSGSYSSTAQGSYPVGELIEASIVNSSNNAFAYLRAAYDAEGFSEWITELGTDDVITDNVSSWFPTYSVRSSAKLWTEMYEYLNSESETAAWLGDLLTQTETSFIRSALESSGIQDLVVRNKAGWISSSTPIYNAICDAGIIEADGHTYVLSIMTSMSYSDAHVELFEALTSALFDVRTSLNLQE